MIPDLVHDGRGKLAPPPLTADELRAALPARDHRVRIDCSTPHVDFFETASTTPDP